MVRIGEGLRLLGDKILGFDQSGPSSKPQEDTSRPPDPRLVADMDRFGEKLSENGSFKPMRGKDAKKAVEEFFGIAPYPVGKLLEFVISNDVLDLEPNTGGRTEYGFARQDALECFGGIARNLGRWMKFGIRNPNAKVLKDAVITTHNGLGSDPRASLIRNPSPARKREKLAQARSQQEAITAGDRADLEEALKPQKRGRKSGIQEPIVVLPKTPGELLKRKILSNIPWFSEEALAKLSNVERRELVVLLINMRDAVDSDEVIFVGDEDAINGEGKYPVDFDIALAVMFVSMFRQEKIGYFDRRLPGLTYQELDVGITSSLRYFDDENLKEKGLENFKQLVLNVEKAMRIAMSRWDTSSR